jgi:class 3 adenylate cyclase
LTASAATFVFADIAGFTALTEAHGDEDGAPAWRMTATISSTAGGSGG